MSEPLNFMKLDYKRDFVGTLLRDPTNSQMQEEIKVDEEAWIRNYINTLKKNKKQMTTTCQQSARELLVDKMQQTQLLGKGSCKSNYLQDGDSSEGQSFQDEDEKSEDSEDLIYDMNSFSDQSRELPLPNYEAMILLTGINKMEDESQNSFDQKISRCNEIEHSINSLNPKFISGDDLGIKTTQSSTRINLLQCIPTSKNEGPKPATQSIYRSTQQVTKANEAKIKKYLAKLKFSEGQIQKSVDELKKGIYFEKKCDIPSIEDQSEPGQQLTDEEKQPKEDLLIRKPGSQYRKKDKKGFFSNQIKSIIFVKFGKEILKNSIDNLDKYKPYNSKVPKQDAKDRLEKAYSDLLEWAEYYSWPLQK